MSLLIFFIATTIILLLYRYIYFHHIIGVDSGVEDYNLENKVFIITGASSGIGQYTAEICYRQGGIVILANRDENKTEKIIKEIKEKYPKSNGRLIFISLDLCNFKSVVNFVKEFHLLNLQLDVLICNAGLNTEDSFTKDGYDKIIQTNVLGHHLLIKLLKNDLENTKNSRIVIVTSIAHKMYLFKNDLNNNFNFLDYIKYPNKKWNNFINVIHTTKQYALSKVLNIYQCIYFSREFENVIVNCCHPGHIKSQITTTAIPWYYYLFFGVAVNLFFKNVKQGSQNTLYLALSEKISNISGKYFDNCQVTEPSNYAQDEKLMKDAMKTCNLIVEPYLRI
ncbi:hypothetical protein ABK040_008937 [Willaertia magna]